MKLLITIVMLASLAPSRYTISHDDDRFVKECIAELNLPTALEEADRMNKSCFIKCMLEKVGAFDKDHGLNMENYKTKFLGEKYVDSDETRRSIEKCADKNTQGSNACEWATRILACLSANVMKIE